MDKENFSLESPIKPIRNRASKPIEDPKRGEKRYEENLKAQKYQNPWNLHLQNSHSEQNEPKKEPKARSMQNPKNHKEKEKGKSMDGKRARETLSPINSLGFLLKNEDLYN